MDLPVRSDGSIHVPIDSRRQQRAQAVQKINHFIPAFGLLGAGIQTLRAGEHGFPFALAIFEVAVSAALLVTAFTVARRVAGANVHAHHGIDWFDVFAAGVLFAEAGEHYHLTHHYARPVILTGILTLGLGLAHGRLTGFAKRRRGFRIDHQGIRISGKPFRGFRAAWDTIASVDLGARHLVVRTKDGRERRLDLADVINVEQVRLAAGEVQRRLAARAIKATA
jgi:hypothetical protein